MAKVTKPLLTALFCGILVAGCDIDFAIGPGHSDFSAPLVGDYLLFRYSGTSVSISPANSTNDTPIIPENVIECAVYEDFILAHRQGLKRRSQNDPNDTYEVPDPDLFDYWILNTSIPEVYGPFDFESFELKMAQMGIPKSTKLKPVNSFREPRTVTEKTPSH